MLAFNKGCWILINKLEFIFMSCFNQPEFWVIFIMLAFKLRGVGF